MGELIRVFNSIANELSKIYPSSPIYFQKVPIEFERPSFYIQYIAGDTDEITNAKRMDNMSFQIVYFAPIDANNIVNIDKQFEEIENIKTPFKKGFLDIVNSNGRKAKVTGLRTDISQDELIFHLDLSISDFTSLPNNDADYETMLEVNTELKNN